MLKSYQQFITESVLFVSPKLREILTKIDDPTSKNLLSLVDTDIKTLYNAIDVTDANDRLSFVSDNQYQAKLRAGQDPNSLFKDTNDKTSITRIVRTILADNGFQHTDAELTKFVLKFKAAWDEATGKVQIRVVQGEEIRKWYHENSYTTEAFEKGTLGKSCMRYSECQDYFDIYTENPDVCKMIILTENGKLRARALLWTTDRGLFLDRVYYTDESEDVLIENWSIQNLGCKFNKGTNGGKPGRFTVKLNGNYFYPYPYVDTFCYFNTKTGVLQNFTPDDTDGFYSLNNTEGEYVDLGTIWSEVHEEWIPRDRAIRSDFYDSWILEDRSVWSKSQGQFILKSDCVWSQFTNDWIPEKNSVQVYIDNDMNKDWMHEDSDDLVWVAGSRFPWLPNLCVQLGFGNWVPKQVCVQVWELDQDEWAKFGQEFGFSLDEVSKLSIPTSLKEKSPVCVSEAIKQHYGFETSGETVWVRRINYYEVVWQNVIYSDKMKELNSDPSNNKDLIKELYAADKYLSEYVKSYQYNNKASKEPLDLYIADYQKFLNIPKVIRVRYPSSGKLKGKIWELSLNVAKQTYATFGMDDGDLERQVDPIVEKIMKQHLIEFVKTHPRYVSPNTYSVTIGDSKFVDMFKGITQDPHELTWCIGVTGCAISESFEFDDDVLMDIDRVDTLRYYVNRKIKFPKHWG